jgi:queuine/archaeosine tRNA-ribosyltransferase
MVSKIQILSKFVWAIRAKKRHTLRCTRNSADQLLKPHNCVHVRKNLKNAKQIIRKFDTG